MYHRFITINLTNIENFIKSFFFEYYEIPRNHFLNV